MAGYWSNLGMFVGGKSIESAASVRYRYSEKPDGTLTYKSKSAYKLAIAHWAMQKAMSLALSEINQLFPRYQRSLERKLRKTVQSQQETNHDWIISNSQPIVDDYGYVTLQGDHKVAAKDAWGRVVPEALMIHYDAEDNIHYKFTSYENQVDPVSGQHTGTSIKTDEFDSKTVLFFDVCPSVSVNSGKNIIMTQVQGRDYTRKELVSGGDLTFTISGSIVAHNAALENVMEKKGKKSQAVATNSVVQYPETQVQKFIQIMQHPGIINVHHFLFRQFNVTRIIIKDFSLKQPEFKNIQPYEFTCVAVEPDEDVMVKQDTINELNKDIKASEMNKWYKFILTNKLGEMAGNMVTDIATSATSLGLDALTFGVSI